MGELQHVKSRQTQKKKLSLCSANKYTEEYHLAMLDRRK